MNGTGVKLVGTFVMAVFALLPIVSRAQPAHREARPLAANVIMPQSRALAFDRSVPVAVTAVQVAVVIREQVAVTTMDVLLFNSNSFRQEAELIVPVPDGAVVRGFTFSGIAAEATAELLPKDEARRLYESIVARTRDPAMLEFIGYNLMRSSVFPVEPNDAMTVRLEYEHVLPVDGNRVDYSLPRSESVDYSVPWTISVTVRSKRPIAAAYSPTHDVRVQHSDDKTVFVELADEAGGHPGPFRLSYLTTRDGMTATVFAYPDPAAGGGYFLFLAGPPPEETPSSPPAIKREVILVLDRSGSMKGDKITQARKAARQILEGLEEGEAFNLVAYNQSVDLFSTDPVVKSATTLEKALKWIDEIAPRGGTNIHDALVEALRMKPRKGVLPIVLFLTDGLPTVGNTSEIAIRKVAADGNSAGRRIFTFGVGADVNTPLLEKIARESRAAATFVLPSEDVEDKVWRVFSNLAGPVLADATLTFQDAQGKSAVSRVSEVIPGVLHDLFRGDQYVVLGRYKGESPLAIQVRGNFKGKTKSFRFSFDLESASTRNSFVPRLWASRRIAVLIDAIREAGADLAFAPDRERVATDPRFKELVEEIVALSTEFGILTEYTAFLAREGTDLTQTSDVVAQASRNLVDRAVSVRSGIGSVNQSVNNQAQRSQESLNLRNEFYDENMNRVAITSVQQVGNRAYYNRDGRWTDSSLVGGVPAVKADRVVIVGSPEFMEVVQTLVEQNRQGTVSLQGEILLELNGQVILIRGE